VHQADPGRVLLLGQPLDLTVGDELDGLLVEAMDAVDRAAGRLP
jgi:hypothetical protein